MISSGAAATERCDVLISYRHEDEPFAERLEQELKRYQVVAFFDKASHHVGHIWRQQWLNSLGAKPPGLDGSIVGPGVIILATAAMQAERPGEDQVVREILDAVACSKSDHGIAIAPLCFDEPGFKALRQRVSTRSGTDVIGARHWANNLADIATKHPETISRDDWDRICREIIRVARSHTLRKLQNLREETLSWANKVTSRFFHPELDLFRATGDFDGIHRILEATEARSEAPRLAIVGAGGTGKTAQLARTLQKVCSDQGSRLYPILLASDDLGREIKRVKKTLNLAASDDFDRLEDIHEWAQGRLVFIVDSLERAPDIETALAHLMRLQSAAAGLVLTCRASIWDKKANDQLKFDNDQTLRIVDIDNATVARELGETQDFVSLHPYLRQALFLDVAAHLRSDKRVGAAQKRLALLSQTALLEALRDWSTDTDQRSTDRSPITEATKAFLKKLAERQVKEQSFHVQISDDDAASSDALRIDSSVEDQLERQRPYLLREVLHSDAVVRLRHDNIDAHNIARLLTDDPTLLTTLLSNADNGFNQIVLEAVAQRAADQIQAGLPTPDHLIEIFEQFVLDCDNKAIPDANKRGWSLGFVLQNKIDIFQNLIRDSLTWTYTQDPPPGDGTKRYSSCRTLNQRTLSSLSSMFLGARPLELSDPGGKTIAALASLVRRDDVAYKGRLLEALPRFDDATDGAATFLLELCTDRRFITGDPGISAYLAEALYDAVRGGLSTIPPAQVLAAVDQMRVLVDQLPSGNGALQRPALRKLIQRRNQIAERLGQAQIAEPAVTELEYLQAFALHHATDPKRVSDWRTFNAYADRLAFDADSSVTSDAVILALGRGLWHDMDNCQVAVARSLGSIDHPFARGLLVHVIATRSDNRVENACLASLAKQAKRLAHREPEREAFAAALARSCAQRWIEMPASREAELTSLLQSLEWHGNRIVTAGALEISAVAVTGAAMSGRPIVFNDDVKHVLDFEAGFDSGPEKERKVALDLWEANRTDTARLSLSASTWRMPHTFHVSVGNALANVPVTSRKALGDRTAEHDHAVTRQVSTVAHCHRLYELFLQGAPPHPHILCLHAIVITADDRKIVRARRSQSADYHAGLWSLTFEEQVREEDLALDTNLVRGVAIRGLEEEFGLDLQPDQVVISDVVAMLEWPSLNICLTACIELACVSEDVIDAGGTDGELIDVEALPFRATLSELAKPYPGVFVDGSGSDIHPTALFRLAYLARLAQ